MLPSPDTTNGSVWHVRHCARACVERTMKIAINTDRCVTRRRTQYPPAHPVAVGSACTRIAATRIHLTRDISVTVGRANNNEGGGERNEEDPYGMACVFVLLLAAADSRANWGIVNHWTGKRRGGGEAGRGWGEFSADGRSHGGATRRGLGPVRCENVIVVIVRPLNPCETRARRVWTPVPERRRVQDRIMSFETPRGLQQRPWPTERPTPLPPSYDDYDYERDVLLPAAATTDPDLDPAPSPVSVPAEWWCAGRRNRGRRPPRSRGHRVGRLVQVRTGRAEAAAWRADTHHRDLRHHNAGPGSEDLPSATVHGHRPDSLGKVLDADIRHAATAPAIEAGGNCHHAGQVQQPGRDHHKSD